MTGDDQRPTAPTQGHEINIDKQRLGAIYARGMLGTTEPRQKSETVLEEFDGLLDDVLTPHPELEATLASPRISPSEKAKILDRIFGGRISDELLTFLKVISEHGRLDCLRQIRVAMHDEFNRLRDRVAVHITTAEPLNNTLRQRIVEQLTSKIGRQIDLRAHVDADILGGLVVRVGDTVFDASVANRLARIKEETINRTSLTLRESTDRFAVSG